MERKLAAILSADVKGYSRLMGEDEEATIRTLTAYREVMATLIQQHRGRVVDSPGDNLLAEFASAVDAVQCAVEIQQELKAKNAELSLPRRMEFRIGINVGDVVVEGERLYGDGVNIAARLEGLAEGGCMCISGTLHDHEVMSLPDKPSIAVLHFVNLSSDPEQEYFSDGITEDLITDLSKLSGLFVIARNSVFFYKGKAVKLEQVSRELGVRYVLEGSVRKAGDRVRITAQLVEASTGYHRWAERYDRPLQEIFTLQDEIRQKIVMALKVQLTQEEQARFRRLPTHNLEAYDAILRGLEYINHSTQAENAQARQLFESAMTLD